MRPASKRGYQRMRRGFRGRHAAITDDFNNWRSYKSWAEKIRGTREEKNRLFTVNTPGGGRTEGRSSGKKRPRPSRPLTAAFVSIRPEVTALGMASLHRDNQQDA